MVRIGQAFRLLCRFLHLRWDFWSLLLPLIKAPESERDAAYSSSSKSTWHVAPDPLEIQPMTANRAKIWLHVRRAHLWTDSWSYQSDPPQTSRSDLWCAPAYWSTANYAVLAQAAKRSCTESDQRWPTFARGTTSSPLSPGSSNQMLVYHRWVPGGCCLA